MDKIIFKNMEDFVLQAEELSSFVGEIIIIGDYQWTKDLINTMIKKTVFTLVGFELNDAMYDGYDKEFLVTLADGEIWVEKYYVNNTYISFDCDQVVMVGSGCSYDAIKNLEDNAADIVFTGDDCSTCEHKDQCDAYNDETIPDEVPEEKQIETHNAPDHNVDFYRQFSDGTEMSINVYSNDSDLIKGVIERFLSEGCDD